jgi:hypothetical protein
MPERVPDGATDSSSEKSKESKDCPHCQGSLLITVSANASNSLDFDPGTFLLPVVLVVDINDTHTVGTVLPQFPPEHGPPTSPVDLRVMLTR